MSPKPGDSKTSAFLQPSLLTFGPAITLVRAVLPSSLPSLPFFPFLSLPSLLPSFLPSSITQIPPVGQAQHWALGHRQPSDSTVALK